jgi:hypothetical protein
MFKILTVSSFSFVLLVTLAQAAFTDVPSSHPHADAIEYVESTGIVSGYDDGTFQPDSVINRVELLKILVESQPSPRDNCGVSASYSDTDDQAWYQPYLEAAACRGIATGYADQSFRPANPVLAVEAFKMITKAFSYALSSVEGDWYVPYVDTLAKKLAIPREIEAPESALTRGQMAEMIYRLEVGINDGQSSHTVDTLLAQAVKVVETAKANGTTFDYVSQNGSVVTITDDGTYRYIKSNGLPNHETGEFPGRGNPHTISAQEISYRVPMEPVYSAESTPVRRLGVALNGIFFEPGTAETWNGDQNWRIEAIQAGERALGLDENYAHVQPTGAYHYHGVPTALVAQIAAQNADDQLLVGYAADGHGIYYSQAGVYTPSYQLRSGTRDSGPGGTYDGTYTSDYQYLANSGDLDDCNGKWVNGEYRYFLTDTYPYQPRCLHGVADPSFETRGSQTGETRPSPGTSLGSSVSQPHGGQMPHEVCESMGASFDRTNHRCQVSNTSSNQTKCEAGQGRFSSGVCQFLPPPGR